MIVSPTRRRRQAVVIALIAVFVLVIFSVGMYRTLAVPQGNAFDFYTLWHGGRVFWEGDNPYSLETAREIQLAVFGELRPETENQQGYAYPAYAAVLIAPFLALPFPVAVSIWSALQLVGIALAAILTALAFGWKPRPIQLGLLLLAVYAYRYAMIVVVIGQTTVLVWLGLAAALHLYQENEDRWAGLALVVAALRPEYGLPLGLLLAVLSFRKGRREVGLAWIAGLGSLTLIALIRRPAWPLDFLAGLRAYSGYAPVLWPPGLFAPWGWLTVIFVLCLIAFNVLMRGQSTRQPRFLIAALIPVLLLLVPQTGSYTLTLALLPALAAFRPSSSVSSRLLAGLLMIAPWVVRASAQDNSALMPVEHLVVPVLASLALTLSLRSNSDTLPTPAGVQ